MTPVVAAIDPSGQVVIDGERLVPEMAEYAARWVRHADRDALGFRHQINDRMLRRNIACAGGSEAAARKVLRALMAQVGMNGDSVAVAGGAA